MAAAGGYNLYAIGCIWSFVAHDLSFDNYDLEVYLTFVAEDTGINQPSYLEHNNLFE
jgi:hypothetical protein